MAKKETITLHEIKSSQATIKIIGDTDLILNKMGNRTKRELIAKQKGKKIPKTESVNEWEDIITSIHWLNDLGNVKPQDYSEDMLQDLLKNNAPCLSAFGLMQQLGKAVSRYGIDKYKTKFIAAVKIITEKRDLIPISFAGYELHEDLIKSKAPSGVPVLSELNVFSGWSAEINIDYVDAMFSIEDIIQVFYLCGWGIGIGSGVTSGYGRFHVEREA